MTLFPERLSDIDGDKIGFIFRRGNIMNGDLIDVYRCKLIVHDGVPLECSFFLVYSFLMVNIPSIQAKKFDFFL